MKVPQTHLFSLKQAIFFLTPSCWGNTAEYPGPMPSHAGSPSISWTLPSCFFSLCPRVALCISPAVRTSSSAGGCTLQPHTWHLLQVGSWISSKAGPFCHGDHPLSYFAVASVSLPARGWAGASSQPPEQPCIGGTPLSVCLVVGGPEHCTAVHIVQGSFRQLWAV